jgi:hypothetical protein
MLSLSPFKRRVLLIRIFEALLPMRPTICGILLLLTSSPLFAREDSTKRSYSWHYFDLIEDLYATSPEQAEESVEYLDLLQPDRLNDLDALYGISSPTAFRINQGDTLNWRRLTNELSADQSQFISNLASRSPQYLWSSRSRVQLSMLAHKEKGYNDGRILGSPHKIYDRLLLSQYGLQAGMLQVKEAGEARTLDHLRGYVSLQEKQDVTSTFSIDRLVVGDYSVSFGSGLLFASGGIVGKSSEVIDAVEPSPRGIQGYLTSGITTGFRGAAASLSLGPATTTLFYSNRYYDGRVDDDTITSLASDGYHRTSSEVARIDATKASLIGANASYQLLNDRSIAIVLGATGYNERFNMPLFGRGFQYNFKGQHLSMLSQHGKLTTQEVGVAYEVAYTEYLQGSAFASTVSAIYEPSKELQFSINGRYLPHDFVSRHGASFGESTDDAQNERGIYLGSKYRFAANFTASAYLDLAGTFVPGFNAQHNAKTIDGLLLLEYRLNSSMKLALRNKFKRKSEEQRVEDVRLLGDRDQFNSRLEHDWSPVSDLRLRSRLEWVHVGYRSIKNDMSEEGILLSTSARISPFEWAMIEARATAFRTDDYDSRLYIYESELQGASGLIMLYGAGMRYSALMNVEPWEGISLGLKYGIMVYTKERKFGDSFTERFGKTDPKMGIQLDIAF